VHHLLRIDVLDGVPAVVSRLPNLMRSVQQPAHVLRYQAVLDEMLTEGADQPAMCTADIRFDRNAGGLQCRAGRREHGLVGPIGRTIHISSGKQGLGRQAGRVRFQHPRGGRQ